MSRVISHRISWISHSLRRTRAKSAQSRCQGPKWSQSQGYLGSSLTNIRRLLSLIPILISEACRSGLKRALVSLETA